MPKPLENPSNGSRCPRPRPVESKVGKKPPQSAGLVSEEVIPAQSWVRVPVIGTIEPDGTLAIFERWKDVAAFGVDAPSSTARMPDRDDPAGPTD